MPKLTLFFVTIHPFIHYPCPQAAWSSQHYIDSKLGSGSLGMRLSIFTLFFFSMSYFCLFTSQSQSMSCIHYTYTLPIIVNHCEKLNRYEDKGYDTLASYHNILFAYKCLFSYLAFIYCTFTIKIHVVCSAILVHVVHDIVYNN